MQKTEDYFEVMEILKNELPKCFRRGNAKLPLAIGIHESVLAHFKNDGRFDADTLKKAIRLYVKGTKYLTSIIEGTPRIDINGDPVSTVKKSDELFALKILTGRKAKTKTFS
jgi:ProP effector